MRILIVTLVLSLTPLSLAAGLSDALALYRSGRFAEAATAGLALKTAPGYALAARATTVLAATRPAGQREVLYVQAEGYARSAVAADPRYAAGYVERARAAGRLAQSRGALAALASGAARVIRQDLETALSLDPGNADAMVGLAAWHAEVWSSGAGWLYGADRAQVVPLFERAISLEPLVIAYRVQYALALFQLGQPEPARAQLTLVLRLKPADAAEGLELENAKRELASAR